MASWKTVATHLHLVAFLLLLFPSCTTPGTARSLEEVKARLDCVDGSDELPWEQVEQHFGRPDENPIPGPGSLFKNARVYKDKIVIFHVDTKRTEEAGRPKFFEAVIRIEVCKER